MKYVQHSVRLPLALDKALRQAAQSRQATTYALLQQCVRAGLASLSGEQTAPFTSRAPPMFTPAPPPVPAPMKPNSPSKSPPHLPGNSAKQEMYDVEHP
jgi:hypothetical protein